MGLGFANWTEIEGFEDYMVSPSGRVLSHKRGSYKELNPQADTDGYLQVMLARDDTRNLRFVHRLVAETFIPRPSWATEVNHIDGNKQNNDVSNLEWTTRSGNMRHAHDNGLANTRKPVKVTNMATGTSEIYRGQHEAARELGLNQGNINHALRGKMRTYRGYKFEYVDGEVM